MSKPQSKTPCPEWCRYRAEHPGDPHDYELWDRNALGRNHEVTFGDTYVAQWELKTGARVTLDAPVIGQAQRYEDMGPVEARLHARDLVAAADLVDRIVAGVYR